MNGIHVAWRKPRLAIERHTLIINEVRHLWVVIAIDVDRRTKGSCVAQHNCISTFIFENTLFGILIVEKKRHKKKHQDIASVQGQSNEIKVCTFRKTKWLGTIVNRMWEVKCSIWDSLLNWEQWRNYVFSSRRSHHFYNYKSEEKFFHVNIINFVTLYRNSHYICMEFFFI